MALDLFIIIIFFFWGGGGGPKASIDGFGFGIPWHLLQAMLPSD